MTKRKIYSLELHEKIKARIPPAIFDAMIKLGWNVFGIYEIVQEEIKKEKMLQK